MNLYFIIGLAIISFTVQAQDNSFPKNKKQIKNKSELDSIEGSISAYVGRVEAAETVQQLAPFAGRTIRQLLPPGSRVKKGQAVLIIAQRTLGETYENYTSNANISGVVNEYHVSPGFEFSSSAPLFTILDVTKHRIKLAVSNKDHKLIKAHHSVQITPEKENSSINGKVYRKSLIPIAGSGLFTVEVEIPNTIPIGTFCEVKFVQNHAKVVMESEAKSKSKKEEFKESP